MSTNGNGEFHIGDRVVYPNHGVGIVEQVGEAVSLFKPGDHVLISCITSCGRCESCRRGMYSHCSTGGWILGNTIDGTQAEYVRIPHADTSLYPIPEGAGEDALVMLSDILPTGFECGVLNGKVAPGSTVAIVGPTAKQMAHVKTKEINVRVFICSSSIVAKSALVQCILTTERTSTPK